MCKTANSNILIQNCSKQILIRVPNGILKKINDINILNINKIIEKRLCRQIKLLKFIKFFFYKIYNNISY